MSRLDNLIKDLCPNGVGYKDLIEVCNISKGIQFNKKDMSKNGSFPVINGGIQPSGYIEQYNCNENTITISQGGASAGYVNFITSRFWAGAHCYILKPNKEVLNRYLYHFVKANEYKLQECQYGAGIPALAKNTIASLTIPVPPLQVQKEIVHILDQFTELTARKKQYEFYRDQLLFPKNIIQTLELKDVVKRSSSGSTPKKNNPDYYDNGTIPWIRTQDVCFNEITKVDSFITEKAVAETSAKWIPENCVIVAISGATAGRCAINKIKATTNQHCLNLEIDSSIALYKYVYYCIHNQYEELIRMKQGARGDLNASLVLSLTIPVPSLEIQSRLVNVLDNFESICSDLKIGLPAEIVARQKQYEYYRDALITYAATGKLVSVSQSTLMP